MKKVTDIVEEIVKANPFMNSLLADGLINFASLARKMKPKIEQELGKSVNEGSIIMSLRRIGVPDIVRNKRLKSVLTRINKITVNSDLIYLSFQNSDDVIQKNKRIIESQIDDKSVFSVFVQGVNEAVLIISADKEEFVVDLFKENKINEFHKNCSALTVEWNLDDFKTPGLFHTVFKQIAWNNINIFEIISTAGELTILVSNEDTDRVFTILKNLKVELV